MGKSPKPYRVVKVDDFPAYVIGFALRWWRSDLRGLTLQAVSEALHRDFSQIARWERAECRLPDGVINEFDKLYGANGLLVNLADALSDLRRYGSTVKVQPIQRREDQDMERRLLMQLIPLLGIQSAINPEVLNRVFDAADKAAGVNSRDPDEWAWTAYERWHYYTTNPPGAAVPLLANDLLQVTGQIEKTESPGVRDGLSRAAAQLAMLMARDLADIGQVGVSVRAFATARRFADASTDRPLAAWVRANEACHSFWLGRPITVIERLAAEAEQIADGKTSPGLMDAYSVRALVGALRGDKAVTHDAVAKMIDVWDRRPYKGNAASGPATWTWARGPLGTRGYALALLGDPTAARELDTAHEYLTRIGHEGGARSLRLIQALHMVKNRDPEGLALAVEIGEETSFSAQRRLIAKQILEALPRDPKVSDQAHRLRELIDQSSRPILPSVR